MLDIHLARRCRTDRARDQEQRIAGPVVRAAFPPAVIALDSHETTESDSQLASEERPVLEIDLLRPIRITTVWRHIHVNSADFGSRRAGNEEKRDDDERERPEQLPRKHHPLPFGIE